MTPSEISNFVRASYTGKIPDGAFISLAPKRYAIALGALAAGGVTSGQIQIAANADFLLTNIAARAAISATPQNIANVPLPLARITFTDTSTDEQWQNVATDLPTYANMGFASWNDEPYPRLIPGLATITVSVASYDTQAYSALDVIFIGVRIKIGV